MFCPVKRIRLSDDDDDNAVGDDDMSVPLWAMTRDALGLAAGDYAAAGGGGGVDGAEVVAEEKEEKEYFEPRMLPSRRKELKELGKPGPRSTCFLCCYKGERDTQMPGDEIHKLVDYLRTHIGRMATIAMATQASAFYEAFRARINSQLQRGETPLPPMTPATILDHLRNHHHDPEVKLIVMLDEVQELRQTILAGVLERSTKTKKTRANKNQVDCLEKVYKIELSLQTRDPTKMWLYSAGARIDTTIHKQGTAATSNKTLYSYLRKRPA